MKVDDFYCSLLICWPSHFVIEDRMAMDDRFLQRSDSSTKVQKQNHGETLQVSVLKFPSQIK